MKKTSKTTQNSGISVVFFGNERIATGVSTVCPTFTKLLESGYKVLAVVVNNEQSASRNRRELEVADVAARYEIPLLAPKNPQDILSQLRDYQADIGVLVSYGRIVSQEMIDLFPGGIVNIHPSLLPLHRGSAPIESAILHGNTKTGVSLMQLCKQMDAGDVYAYSEYELRGNEQKQTLADALLELGSEMMVMTLPRILRGEIIGRPQDDAGATYDKHITKQDGRIDLAKSAVQLEREVRAYLGWPGSRTVIAGKDVIVTAAHVADNSVENVDKKSTFVANKQLCLQTADGILVIDTLKPAGRPAMPATAFLAGHAKYL